MTISPLIDFSKTGIPVGQSYAGTPMEFTSLLTCQADAAAKSAVLGIINKQSLMSMLTMIDHFELDLKNAKAFNNASADTVLHFDLMDGCEMLIKEDIFAPFKLGVVIAAATTTPKEGTFDSLGRLYIPAVLDTAVTADADVSILNNLNFFPLKEALRAAIGNNDKKVADTALQKVANRKMMGYEIIDTFSFLLRVRVTTTAAALASIGKTLAIVTKAKINCSEVFGQ